MCRQLPAAFGVEAVRACSASLFPLFPPLLGRATLSNFEQMSPSPVSDTSTIFFLNYHLQIGGGRMGRGLLPTMLNMGWGVCVCISLNFPRNDVSFFSQSKIKRVGRERREAAKSQV